MEQNGSVFLTTTTSRSLVVLRLGQQELLHRMILRPFHHGQGPQGVEDRGDLNLGHLAIHDLSYNY